MITPQPSWSRGWPTPSSWPLWNSTGQLYRTAVARNHRDVGGCLWRGRRRERGTTPSRCWSRWGLSLHLSSSMLGLGTRRRLQFGVTFGIAFPATARRRGAGVRRLLTVTIILQAAAMAGVAFAPDGTSLLLLSLMVGFFGIAPYVLPPYAAVARTPLTQRGRVIAHCWRRASSSACCWPEAGQWRNRFP